MTGCNRIKQDVLLRVNRNVAECAMLDSNYIIFQSESDLIDILLYSKYYVCIIDWHGDFVMFSNDIIPV